jgi:hypothetical protein
MVASPGGECQFQRPNATLIYRSGPTGLIAGLVWPQMFAAAHRTTSELYAHVARSKSRQTEKVDPQIRTRPWYWWRVRS